MHTRPALHPTARFRAAHRCSLRFARSVLVLAASAAPLVAQHPREADRQEQRPAGPLWESYERAADVLRQALAAHGGADAVRGITALSYRWEGEDFAPTQGRVPSAAWDTAGNGRAAVQDVRVDYARNRYVFDREFRFPGGYLNAIHIAADGRELVAYNPYPDRGMGGTDYQRDTAGTAARRNMSALAAAMPVLLLRAATTRASTLRWLGETGDAGHREQAVGFTTADGDPVTLYFDAESHLLTRFEEMGLGSLGDEVDARIFSDYRSEAGLAVPHRMDVRWNGLLTGTHRLTRFATTAGLGDSLTTVPAGYVPSTPAAPPAIEKVADGVYYVERLGGGYRMLVVDTDDGVLVVDAPISPQVAESAIALVEKTLPGRPIRWVALTHHHGDHIGGVPAFAARGVTVLVAPGSEEYVRRASSVRRTIGQLGAAAAPPPPPAAPAIEAVRGRRSLGRGAHAVQVLDVSPTSHAAAMLVVWVPAAKLLFQGDLLRINAHGGPVASPEATRDLDRIIRRFGLDVRTIGAVHGTNGTIDDLRAALRKGE